MTIEEIEKLTMEEVEARKAEIQTIVDNKDSEADFDSLSAEVDLLEARKAALIEEQRKADLVAVANGEGEETNTIIPQEERKMPTLEEIRKSVAYEDAYAQYIKTGKDTECRKLLTELASSDNGDNVVPVPVVVEEEIKTAWANNEILSRVNKTYIKGVLRVGFELSATGATAHAEGADAPSEEELILGVVTMTPTSIKKWITISDEAIDLTGSAFLRYIYDELTYQIAKAIEDAIVADITGADSTSSATAIGVPVVGADLAISTISQAMAELGDRATNPVIIMNKKTYAAFKAVQYAGQFNVDPFEGLTVLFNNTLKAYDVAGDDDVYAIVGDLRGYQANFPNGDGVTIKYDDLSLAEADLVKVVGREYVALAITTPEMFVNITKASES